MKVAGTDVLHDAVAELAECPIWIPKSETVTWTDSLAGSVWVTTLSGSTTLRQGLNRPVGAIALADDGNLIAATSMGLEHLPAPGSTLVPRPDSHSALRMNDGKAEPVGRLLRGSIGNPTPEPDDGSLWSFEGATARQLRSGVTSSNGLFWSEDWETPYYVDTPPQRIDAFAYGVSTGEVQQRQTMVHIPETASAPHGLTIDSEGGRWVTFWGGGCVPRYRGKTLTHELALPTPHPTCPMFARNGLDLLVITTAARPIGNQIPLGAGALDVASTKVHGLQARGFPRISK